ncbi:hypothetical protein PPS11_35620 [Pseudomonas putida S11]|nr:hypothetical protein PPS11_35620 [Pseudomonas putida S11]
MGRYQPSTGNCHAWRSCWYWLSEPPQLRLPVTVQAFTVQLVDALVIGRVHVQPQHQLQALGTRAAQAVGQPAAGTAEIAVAIGAPLHDQGFAALGHGGMPQLLPLGGGDIGVAVQGLVEQALVGAGWQAQGKQAEGQERTHQKVISAPTSTPLARSYRLPPSDCWYSARTFSEPR